MMKRKQHKPEFKARVERKFLSPCYLARCRIQLPRDELVSAAT